MDIKVLGIDLGKTVCSLSGLDGTGAVVLPNASSDIGYWPFWKGCRPV